MSDDQLETLKKAALAATPQNLDSAEIINREPGLVDCPTCGGDGYAQFHADYCNYDGHALGVQFYGIGPEHLAAEAYFRAASPAVVLALIERVERAESRIAELEAARIAYASEFPADAEGLPDVGNVHANIRAMKGRIENLAAVLSKADESWRAPDIVREALEATFEQRPGYLTKVSAAIRALPPKEKP